MVEPHQSIPNLGVKQHGGDNTCGVTCWKNNLVPGKKKGVFFQNKIQRQKGWLILSNIPTHLLVLLAFLVRHDLLEIKERSRVIDQVLCRGTYNQEVMSEVILRSKAVIGLGAYDYRIRLLYRGPPSSSGSSRNAIASLAARQEFPFVPFRKASLFSHRAFYRKAKIGAFEKLNQPAC